MKRALLIVVACGMFLTGYAQKGSSAVPVSKNEELNRAYCRGLFRSAEGLYFDLLDQSSANGIAAYQNILDWLQGRVPGLTLVARNDFSRVPYLRNTPASVFINEIPMAYESLASVPVTDIAMVKVIRTPFMGGMGNASGGAIAIYTIGAEGLEE